MKKADAAGQGSGRRRRFVEAYMGEAAGNATQAAISAGYSPKTAKQQGSQLLTFVDVQRAIQTRVAADPAITTREERQRFWSDVMMARGQHVGVDMAQRLRASELLGRSQGDFIERQDTRADVTYHLTWDMPASLEER